MTSPNSYVRFARLKHGCSASSVNGASEMRPWFNSCWCFKSSIGMVLDHTSRHAIVNRPPPPEMSRTRITNESKRRDTAQEQWSTPFTSLCPTEALNTSKKWNCSLEKSSRGWEQQKSSSNQLVNSNHGEMRSSAISDQTWYRRFFADQ